MHMMVMQPRQQRAAAAVDLFLSRRSQRSADLGDDSVPHQHVNALPTA
jgi:hypothetical protein